MSNPITNAWDWVKEHNGAIAAIAGVAAVLIAVIPLLSGDPDPLENGEAPDIVMGEAIQGYTVEKHRALLERRMAELQAEIEADTGTDLHLARNQLIEAQRKLENLQTSFADRERELARLRSKLSDIGEGFPQAKIDAAKQALYEGDSSKADALFAEVEAMEQEGIDRAADAAFQRGRIAEEEIRWHDAAEHYGKAATLAPTYVRLYAASRFAWRAGDLRRSVQYGEDFVDLAEEEFGNNSTEYSSALNYHGAKLQNLGRYAEAEPLLREAIEIDKATIGEGHPDYAIRLNNLAVLMADMKRFDDAKPLYARMIEIDLATLGKDHPSTILHAGNYADVLRQHFPDDPALAELEAIFGPDIGK